MRLSGGRLIKTFRSVTLLFLIALMLSTGCTRGRNNVFEAGAFDYQWNVYPFRVGVTSNTDVFSVKAVELTLCYGLYEENTKYSPKRMYTSSGFEDAKIFLAVYFCDGREDYKTSLQVREFKNIENYYYIKTVPEEELFTREYSYTEDLKNGTTYRHHEVVTVPREIFNREKGDFAIKLVTFREPFAEGDDYCSTNMTTVELKYETIDHNAYMIIILFFVLVLFARKYFPFPQ